jgi:hypothetical protein
MEFRGHIHGSCAGREKASFFLDTEEVTGSNPVSPTLSD